MTENAKRGRKVLFTSPRDQLSIRVSPETHARLKSMCDLRGKKKTETINEIINEAFEWHMLDNLAEMPPELVPNTTEATE